MPFSRNIRKLIMLLLAALFLLTFVFFELREAVSLKPIMIAKSNGQPVQVISFAEKPFAIAFETGMTIDADGAPDAYAPGNKGTDDLAHGGNPGNWWALVTSNNKPSGIPIVKNGYYVSMTSLEDDSRATDDPARYVNANCIPFFVLPPMLKERAGAHLGDVGVVVNLQNGKSSSAIFADEGPEDHLGEGSVALARALDIDANPRSGGTDAGILYIVFPNSGNGKPLASAQIKERASILIKDLGGLEHLLLSWNLSKMFHPGTEAVK